jgi:glycosyltransferase involved in cell wall biosynthesis
MVGADVTIVAQFQQIANLLGQLSHQDMASFYNASDVFVFPTRFDSFGMVVAEALACGLPVIVSENAGAKDLIEEGVNGWVVPAGNAAALAERMAWCAAHPTEVRAMSAAARSSAEHRDWQSYRSQVADVIEAFLLEWKSRRDGAGWPSLSPPTQPAKG